MIATAPPGAAIRAKPGGADSSTRVSVASSGGGGSTDVPSPRMFSILVRRVGLAVLVPPQVSAS